MKKLLLIAALVLVGKLSFAQVGQTEDLIKAGIALNDSGDYKGAIAKYDAALAIDKDNVWAMAEKATSLYLSSELFKAADLCEDIIKKHKDYKEIGLVYLTYANVLDAQHKPDDAIKQYDKAIKASPDDYQCYFNKGICLAGQEKYDDALECFQKSAAINPYHAGTQNALARILDYQKKNVPALLAFCRFYILEPQGERAEKNFALLDKIMQGNVTTNEKGDITINIDPAAMGDDKKKGKKAQNDFSSTELILAMLPAIYMSDSLVHQSDLDKFTSKLETVISSLEEGQKDGKGFYWDFYVPYFAAMHDKKYLKTLAAIIYLSNNDKDAVDWIQNHKQDISDFYDWSKQFKWASK